MKEKLKKNWKTIVIVLLVLFSLNKCTVSCNRGQKLTKVNTELVQKDSMIKTMSDSIKTLNQSINSLSTQTDMLKGFNKQQAMSDSLNRAAQKEQMSTIKKMMRKK